MPTHRAFLLFELGIALLLLLCSIPIITMQLIKLEHDYVVIKKTITTETDHEA